MSSSDALRVKMTMQQFAQLRDQLVLGLLRKREPHGGGRSIDYLLVVRTIL
jgi:hypothetical protein